MQREILIRTLIGAFFWGLMVVPCRGQEDFQVKWTMDNTQAGASNHMNFTPSNAVLAGGANTYTLPNVYSAGGAIGLGYLTRPWPAAFSAGRYMEFSFTANSFKYDITGISFRLRRSANGAKQFKLRSSADGFSADLKSDNIPTASNFYSYQVPVNFKNLSNNSFTIRIYGFDPVDIYGTLWFDEIVVSGKVLAIILPMSLTRFQAVPTGYGVIVSWQTSYERNGKKFIIERSNDMKLFEQIGSVDAAGDTDYTADYAFEDTNPSPGPNYYRLKMVDRDGHYSFSDIIDVIVNGSDHVVRITPNPAPPEKITITGKIHAPSSLALQTSSGRRIAFEYAENSGGTIILQPFHPLSPGIYVLSFVENGRKEHVKILVR